MANDVNITGISRQTLQQLGSEFARAAAGGSAAGTSSAAQQQNQQTQAVQGNIRAVKEQSEAYKTAKKKIKGFGDGIDDFLNSIQGVIGSTLIQNTLKEFRSGVQGGVEAVNGWSGYFERQIVAYKDLGITVEELHNFNKTARAASINLGGFGEWTGKLTEKQSFYFARIGDLTEATKHQAEMMERLTHTGTEAADLYGPFGKQLNNINDDLLKLGVSYEESREIFKGFTEDEDVRHRLRGAADEQQRKQIMLEVQGRIKHFKMLGMTTEQAKKASQALEHLGGKKPLDRFKQAAKAQAALSAMGIEGSAEVANIIRKGARATETERERLAEVYGEAQNIAAETAQGPMAQEFFVRGLIEKTGLEDMMGKGGIFSKRLDKGAQVSQEQLDKLSILGQHTPILTKTAETIDKVYNFVSNNPWAKGTLELIGNIGDLVKDFLPFLNKIPKIASFLKMGLGTAGPLAMATFGTWQAAKAIKTGESDVWNAITDSAPELSEWISNSIGKTYDSFINRLSGGGVLGFGEDAREHLRAMEQFHKTEVEQNKKTQEINKNQEQKQDKQLKATEDTRDSMKDLADTIKQTGLGGFGPPGGMEELMNNFKELNQVMSELNATNQEIASGMNRIPTNVSVQ